MSTGTLISTTPAEEAARRRLIEFAADAAQLADQRADLELRELATMDDHDRERLELLDNIAARMPDLDLDGHEVEWTTMPDDGSQALVVDGGGFDGDNGFVIATHGDDLHAVGPTAPMFPGYVGCVVIRPDGSRYVARVEADPLGGRTPS